MLGRQALLRRVELGGLPVGVLQGLERADRLVLVDVGRRVLQGLDTPVGADDTLVILPAMAGG